MLASHAMCNLLKTWKEARGDGRPVEAGTAGRQVDSGVSGA